MSWKSERVYSGDHKDRLSEDNHISANFDLFYEAYNISSNPKTIANEEDNNLVNSRLVSSWASDIIEKITEKNEEGNPLDILIWSNGDKFIWLPYVEHLTFLDFFKMAKRENVNFGYINGRCSYLGPFMTPGMCSISIAPGYTMWIQAPKIEELETVSIND